MWLQLPSLLLLNLRVRSNLRRLGFAAALAAYAPPNSRKFKTVGTEALAFSQASALWLRRFANVSQRLPSFGAWLNRLFGPSACLDQSITLRTFLQARGLPAELKIGSKHPAGQSFSAHAWIELSGVAIGERPDVVQAHAVFPTRL
jgi:hypothetical protein